MTKPLRVSHQMAELAFDGTELKRYRKISQVFAVQIETDLEIETREGWLKARKGDYLVCNVSDIRYPWPVKREIFESTYERVE